MESFPAPDWTDDPRSTAELFALAKLESLADDEAEHDRRTAVSLLQRRATPEVFQAAERFSRSGDAVERRLAAAVLGQIGWSARVFLAESVALLIPLLSDTDFSVIAAAASALGHRSDAAAIPYVLPLIGHSDADVRFGVMAALSCQDDPRAIAGLIELTRDENTAVRDWATFGLGSQTEVDTPELREALLARIVDADDATRGEAVIGLANRRDLRVVAPLIRELTGKYYGIDAVEAAKAFPLPVFYEYLLPLRPLIVEHNPWFLGSYEAVLVACRPAEQIPAGLPGSKNEEGQEA